MSRSFYITTPIYYVNAEPHLGHAYTTIVADVAARYHKLLGYQVRFQTGTDEHGDKIAEAAAKKGLEPKDFVDQISQMFRDTWPPLLIENDHNIRTTDPEHIAVVQKILQKVHDAGDIYRATYGGNYCVGCERFLTDKDLVDGKCPDHGTVPQYIEEENYFFKMSKYQDALVEHIKAKPDFIRPERYKNEVLAMLADPLDDLCISRPKTRLTWGIELPFDRDFVTYVWFDALINYVTGLGWPEDPMFETFWPHTQHLIAKDILKPHAIYWPTMLLAAGLPLYDHLNVHGYWKVNEGKMSKSLGNVVRPLDLVDIYGVNAFRYFLLREMSFGLDAGFSEEALVGRFNADLANDLGNLFSRVLGMLHKYRNGVLPPRHPEAFTELDQGLLASVAGWSELPELLKAMQFHRALEKIWAVMGEANRYIVSNEPWTLARDEAQSHRLDNVLHLLTQLLASLAHIIWPVMPGTAAQMAHTLDTGIQIPAPWDALVGLDILDAGHQTRAPQPLFPRVETKGSQEKAAKKEQKAEAKSAPQESPKAKTALHAEEPKPEITIEQFGQLQFKVGVVLGCQKVKGADRLLHLSVDLGEPEPRSIVSGIAQHYAPEDLVGKQVVVVANLKPAKLRGIPSQGMVLAAVSGDKLTLVSPSVAMPVGSVVR